MLVDSFHRMRIISVDYLQGVLKREAEERWKGSAL